MRSPSSSRGSPSTRSAMTLRTIWFVPPPMEADCELSSWSDQRPASGSSAVQAMACMPAVSTATRADSWTSCAMASLSTEAAAPSPPLAFTSR